MIDFLLDLATVAALIMFIIIMTIFGIMIIMALVGACVEIINEIRKGSET